jgi:hypothetical protein
LANLLTMSAGPSSPVTQVAAALLSYRKATISMTEAIALLPGFTNINSMASFLQGMPSFRLKLLPLTGNTKLVLRSSGAEVPLQVLSDAKGANKFVLLRGPTCSFRDIREHPQALSDSVYVTNQSDEFAIKTEGKGSKSRDILVKKIPLADYRKLVAAITSVRDGTDFAGPANAAPPAAMVSQTGEDIEL